MQWGQVCGGVRHHIRQSEDIWWISGGREEHDQVKQQIQI